jgi:hypothetical protein
MSISVTPSELGVELSEIGQRKRFARLVVTGLPAAAANAIPHGLPARPYAVIYQATSGTPGFETSDPDETDLHYTTGAGQTSLKAYVWY